MSKKNQPVIEVSSLQMRYGENVVLSDVTFTVNKGEIVVLLGPNGAGKTTTIEILEGFRARSGGDVRVLGVDPVKGDETWRSEIGMVLQSWRDHGKWGVRELLAHLGKYYEGYDTPERKRPMDTDALLEMVGLTEHASKKINQLSGGQRRRVDVAIGLVGNPRLLFLDEPTVGFDPKARREFHDIIHRLADLQDTAILLTTHDLDEAEKLSDRIMILAGGEIVASGSADQLAREMAEKNEIIWSQGGKRHVHSATDATAFVRKLLSDHPQGISELEVSRASLEDVYIAIVQKNEQTAVKEGK
jgi:ABC-2 type transport system ATP-binding protein